LQPNFLAAPSKPKEKDLSYEFDESINENPNIFQIGVNVLGNPKKAPEESSLEK